MLLFHAKLLTSTLPLQQARSLFLVLFQVPFQVSFQVFAVSAALKLFKALAWAALGMIFSFAVQAQTQILGNPSARQAVGNVVKTPQVQASLFVNAPRGIQAGETIWLGLQLVHQADWHTYWRNPGDSGLPTDLQWTLPAGIVAGDLIWPAPKKIPIGTLANFGYEGTVMLVTPFKISPQFKTTQANSEVQFQLHANWLVCKQECIPQEGDFSLSVPLHSTTSMANEAFQKALSQQAQVLKGAHQAVISSDGRSVQLKVAGLPPELSNGPWTIFPQTANVVLNSASPQIQNSNDTTSNQVDVIVQVSSERMDSPRRMSWLLVQGTAKSPTGLQWTFETPVQGQWQEFTQDLKATGNDPSNTAAAAASALNAAPFATWVLALLGAFLGGVLLNFMPCVFPVLAIKLLSITQQADRPKEMRLSAWAFSVGVLVSFLLLGGVMLGLRAAGSQLGWGFQLQSPWVVGALAFMFVVIGLNLSGLFEFGSFVPSSVSSFQWAHPATNALWSGVFAVLIASPCTAPFMGASLGLAIGFPTWQALPIFGFMGIGMALPFILVSFSATWVRFLPRPGAWMVTFRHIMALPMYATAIWLVWVLGLQTGTWENTQVDPPSAVSATGSGGAAASPQPVVWEAWSAEKVSGARQAGRPVFVDFTAAWCVTCQFNKKTTFADAALLNDFAQKKVLLLRADWTRYDPAITKALNELGRNGLPVYAWYAPGAPVVILSELPSVKEVQNALGQVKTAP